MLPSSDPEPASDCPQCLWPSPSLDLTPSPRPTRHPLGHCEFCSEFQKILLGHSVRFPGLATALPPSLIHFEYLHLPRPTITSIFHKSIHSQIVADPRARAGRHTVHLNKIFLQSAGRRDMNVMNRLSDGRELQQH